MEKGNKTIQLLSLIGFISNYIWAVFAILLVWGIVQWTDEAVGTIFYPNNLYTPTIHRHLTIYAIIMLISAYTAAAGFLISNIISIKETIKLVKPLKITSVVCIVYLWVFGTVMTPIEPENESIKRLLSLAALAWMAFQVTAIGAFIISKINKDKATIVDIAPTNDITQPTIKTESEPRTEIEEKTSEELMEKNKGEGTE